MPSKRQAVVHVYTRYLSVSQAARILSVDPRTVRREVERGVLPAVRIGPRRIIRIHPDDLSLIGTNPRRKESEEER